MKIIEKDILTVENGIIIHQVNMQKTMGSGLALQLKTKWPKVYDSYMNYSKSGAFRLGGVDIVEVDKGLYVANCIGQEFYGRDKSIVYTNYAALEECLAKVFWFSSEMPFFFDWPPKQVYIPYNLGCGLANGDWGIVSQIIENELPDAIICKLP